MARYSIGFSETPRSLFFAEISKSLCCFLRSYAVTPTKLSVSQMSIVLIFLSKGELLDKEGEILTSRSHGFSLLSSNISKPYTSKQTFLCLVFLYYVFTMCGSTEMRVLIITSFILFLVPLKSRPSFSN